MDKKIQGVVFDLYGTLLFSHKNVVLYDIILKNGDLSYEGYQPLRRAALTMHFDDFCEMMDRTMPAVAKAAADLRIAVEDDIPYIELFPETMQTLSRLRDCGYQVGLISNLCTIDIPPFFLLGIDKMVDYAVFSCGEGFIKPEPQIYKKMILLMGLSAPEILMVGDKIEPDVRGPRSIGMNALLIDRMSPDRGGESIRSLDGIFSYI